MTLAEKIRKFIEDERELTNYSHWNDQYENGVACGRGDILSSLEELLNKNDSE